MTPLFSVFLLLGISIGTGLAQDSSCTNKPCDANHYCVDMPPSSDGPAYYCIQNGYRLGNCSLNAKATCDEGTFCEETNDHHNYRCVCETSGAPGDGVKPSKGGTGCQLSYKKCATNKECPEGGHCDIIKTQCVCNDGYLGDGFNCTDIVDCDPLKEPVCDPNAFCEDIPGSYMCTCDGSKNFKGDGKICVLSCNNDNDCDAPRAYCNDDDECRCKAGYNGTGDQCDDINECMSDELNDCPDGSNCINTDGGYECKCKNGYFGDGKTCDLLPKNCDEIDNPKSGNIYIIDPDGTGPANNFQVECAKIKGVLVTKVYPKNKLPTDATYTTEKIDVDYDPEPEDLQPLVNGSAFCYQDITFQCYKYFRLFPGTEWVDAFGNAHANWGSDLKHHCACGATRKCEGGCFCDGKQSSWLTAEKGRIIDKNRLPFVKMTFDAPGKRKGKLEVGPLICAQQPVGLPSDCDDAKKNYGVKRDTPLYIDVDGPGPQPPILVFCDVESYDHVGITEISPDDKSFSPRTSDEQDVKYTVPGDSMKGLIEGSVFCSQFIEFHCLNSPLLGDNGGYIVGPNRRLDYFPGANGEQGMCGCGATRSCLSPEVTCNCNLPGGGGGIMSDFGLIIDKTDLPALKLSANVNSGKARINVHPLRCSQAQFGLEPNCEKYRTVGVNKDYTYLIDPDGPGNLDPYLVECRFKANPPLGETVVHHEEEDSQNLGEPFFDLKYLKVSPEQIDALKKRSTFCVQDIKVKCQKLKVQSTDSIEFVPGNGTSPLALADFLSTCGDNGCNCDGVAVAEDSGMLEDLGLVPIKSLDFTDIQSQISGGANGQVEVGPMICSEIFPSCEDLQKFVNSDLAVAGEGDVVNGVFTIDPDGAGGVEPFSVRCQFPSTLVDIIGGTGGVQPPPGSGTPIDKCFKVNYKSSTGEQISDAQINALVARSGKCRQDLTLECTDAPATGNINYTTCDGKPQKGWGGSYGADKCACGVSGICAGGRDANCNCDKNDDVTRFDKGTIRDNNRLPVCEVCLRVSPKQASGSNPPPTSRLKYRVGQLRCDGNPGTKGDCQNSRKSSNLIYSSGEKSKEVPTTLSFGGYNVPVSCRFYHEPPVGMLEIKPRDPVIPPKGNENVNETINYILLRIDLVMRLISRHEYCRQKIFLFCLGDQNLVIGTEEGFFDLEGDRTNEWLDLDSDGKDVTDACQQYSELCNKCGRPKGFLITRKETMPVASVILAVKGVTVVVDNLECLNIKRSCQDMLNSGNIWFGYLGSKRYLIDPDGPLENFPFKVGCEFNKKEKNGVTIVLPDGQWQGNVVVKDQSEPGKFKIPITYKDASPKQIKGLSKISEFCWQGIKYSCKHSPLLDGGVNPDSYYSFYGDNGPEPSFGTGARVNYPGCACGLLGTCVNPNVMCNCDARGPMGVDQGVVSDKDKLPLDSFSVGGQTDASQATISTNSIRCGSKRIEPPKHCAHALKLGNAYGIDFTKTGEYLISPDPVNVVPFMVRCEFDKFPGKAVTVIKPNKEPREPNTDPKEPTEVPYKGPKDDQIRALIAESAYCYQGVRFDCYASVLLKGGSYWKTTGRNGNNYFWGGGEPRGAKDGVCACGKNGQCGGLDSRQGQRDRRCNCDVADNFPRADAGIITQKEFLPISDFIFVTNELEQDLNMTIGDLYCSEEPLDLNECEMGFSDCHPLAECVDEKTDYRCVCKPGWQGKTTVSDPNRPRANGRECIDDDECSWNPCPYTANCTNTPGSFYCTCKKGFRQTGPLECKDINECAEDALNDCDANARCENLLGSYRCACKRGYRGDGKKCYPIGQCSCFGDPHCHSFDNRWLHFQGMCQYVMAQDNCKDDDGFPNFLVLTKHWKRGSQRPGYFSWIKSVRVITEGFHIDLGQGGEILIDGIKVLQFLTPSGLSVLKIRQTVVLRSSLGLEIKWDGRNSVDLTIPASLKGDTCGLCGNYNDQPNDDWTVGPMCEVKAGQVTGNFALFGNSWTDPYDGTCEVDCNPEVPVYPTPCANQQLMETECRKIFDITNLESPFRQCLALMDDSEIDVMREACAFDLCQESENFRVALCGIAEKLASKCRVELNFIVIGWRESTEACGELECGNNMMYKKCGSIYPQTCLSNQMNIEENVNENDCVEGCFCAEGMVMDIDRCVPQEECGCMYQMKYLKKGEVMYTADCQYKVKCLGNDVIEKTSMECGENQECTVDDGVAGCYCREGFIMASDSNNCYVDPCGSVECNTTNQKCVDGICQCVMGYVGDCKQCVNIDECATGLANCNRIGQSCTDLPGSYLCECEAGFIPTGNGCQDIDECAVFSDTCGANSQCSNTLGRYECECCSGYKKNNKDECVRDLGVPKGGQCCACQGDKCTEPGQVCGRDGVTYKDYRTLVVASCRDEAKKDVKLNYPGKCKSTCEMVVCKKQFSVCQMVDASPKCNCPKCENSTFSINEQTVCATNKITYNSVCHMKEASCEAELETTVEVETFGRPCGQGPSDPVGPWGEWGDCSEKCQQGVKNRTRNVPEGSGLPSIVVVPCFSTCYEGPCTQTTCTAPGQVCTVDGNNVASCTCMDCSDYPEELICGRLGPVIQTYPNECALQAEACKKSQPDYEVLEPRACEEKPTNCSIVRNYVRPEDDNGCKAVGSINIGLCDGGCDKTGELCCYGDSTLEKQTVMRCTGGARYSKTVKTIIGCNCLTTEQVKSLEMAMNVVP